MASNSSENPKQVDGDVDSVTRINGRKCGDGLIEIRLVGHPHAYRVRIDLDKSAPIVTELHILPSDGGGNGIGANTLRAIPVSRLAAAAARHIRITELPFAVAGSDDPTARLRPDHVRGRILDDVHYRDVAEQLKFARECGLSPREHVRQLFNASIPTVDRWIKQAKQLGFLDPNWSNNNGRSIK